MTSLTLRPAGVRSALLDAAYDAMVAGTWSRTRMVDVARSAGVSRQTLYNEFGSKAALAEALSARQTADLLDGVAAVLADPVLGDPMDGSSLPGNSADGDPLGVLRAAVRWALDRCHDDPLLKAILTAAHDGGDNPLLHLITTGAQPLLDAAGGLLFDFLVRHWPDVPADRLTPLAETVVRLLVSHVVLPTEPTETTAGYVTDLAAAVLARSTGGIA